MYGWYGCLQLNGLLDMVLAAPLAPKDASRGESSRKEGGGRVREEGKGSQRGRLTVAGDDSSSD